MTLSGSIKKEKEIANAFQTHFRKKVEDIIENTKKTSTVYNGERLFDACDENFMTLENVTNVMKG